MMVVRENASATAAAATAAVGGFVVAASAHSRQKGVGVVCLALSEISVSAGGEVLGAKEHEHNSHLAVFPPHFTDLFLELS